MGFGEAAGGVDGEVQQTVLRRAARRDGDDGPQKVVSGVTQRVEECTCLMQHQVAGVGLIRVTMCALVQPD